MPRVLSQVVENRQLQGYEIAVGSLALDDGGTEDALTHALLEALEHNQLVLPSLPDVALKVSNAVQDETSDAHTIAKIVQADLAITAKLIGAANSAYYGGSEPVHSCSDAVVRLGMKVSHNLVLAYVVWELFRVKSRALQQRMRSLWHHSNKVAAICHVLALRDKRFKPDEAMLIGLLHDIGVAAILHQVAQYPDFATDPKAIDHAIAHLRGPIGSSILRKWGFQQEFVTAALEAEDWLREGTSKPDYCDLVIVAQLHSFIGSEQMPHVPPLDQVPALVRLGLSELGPEQSLKILAAAAQEIKESELLLA
jgi:HD-like signal output (HDOD) protein